MKIKLTENKLKQIVAESVKKVLHSINESKPVNNKPLDNPDSDFSWESIGKHQEREWNKRPEYNFPCLPNLNTKIIKYLENKYHDEVLPYGGDDDDRDYVEALLNLGFKKDGYDREGNEVFSNGKLRVVLSIDSINDVLIVSPANGYASTLGL